MDRILDRACVGPTYLKRTDVAQMMVEAIRYRDSEQYLLDRFVVMSNHVHLLITPRAGLEKITKSLKGFTARQGNLMLGLTGRPFWQDKSYDRLVRNAEEFGRIVKYIAMNPVRAGLVCEPGNFPWCGGSRLEIGSQVNNLPHRV
jgi:REP element-mobilizing transposase RayT